ncbi:C-type lectin domain family 2 member B [Pogona vitticeps]
MCEEGKANSGDPTANEKSDCNGNSKNEPKASENTELMIEPLQGAKPRGCGWRANLREMPFWKRVTIVGAIASVVCVITALVVWPATGDTKNPSEATPYTKGPGLTAVQECAQDTGSIDLDLVVIMNKSSPDPCPSGWVKHERKCYYFSKAESDWDSSQRTGASLARIDTKEELDFIVSNLKYPYHWIGLRRKNNQTWKWTNGSEYNGSLFQFGADGDCAYLNDVSSKASSTRCRSPRYWICSKSLSAF